MTVKIEALHDGEWRPLYYSNNFSREATTGEDRLCIGVKENHVDLITSLLSLLSPPFALLYVLHTPRGGSVPGRYQSPWMERTDLEKLFTDFGPFFSEDSRHDIWVRSDPDDATVVWDRHDIIYVYGPLEKFEKDLYYYGFKAGLPEIPIPHAHRYYMEWDEAERTLTQEYSWHVTPLHERDEQFKSSD